MVWATGFMFLISWRGYWQELIESIVWAHEHTRIANLVYSCTGQARLVGLAHFSIGYVLSRHGSNTFRVRDLLHEEHPTERTMDGSNRPTRPTTRTTHLPGGSATKRQRPLAAKPIHSSLGSSSLSLCPLDRRSTSNFNWFSDPQTSDR